MEYNLYSPNGTELSYPHWTKWLNEKVWVISNPKSKINVNDIVFTAQETKLPNGEVTHAYFNKRHRVTEILEERKARGQHVVDFEPLFQLVKVQRISE